MRLHVLDATALVALFDAHPPIMSLYRRAEEKKLLLGFPAAAIAEANASIGGGFDAWQAIMLDHAVVGLPLAEFIAIEIAGWPGELGVRHAVYEAKQTAGAVVTRKPGAYEGLQVPLLVV